MKAGSIVEYVSERAATGHVTIGEGTIAVITSVAGSRLSVTDENSRDKEIQRFQVVASDWAGFVPESLEELFDELNDSGEYDW